MLIRARYVSMEADWRKGGRFQLCLGAKRTPPELRGLSLYCERHRDQNGLCVMRVAIRVIGVVGPLEPPISFVVPDVVIGEGTGRLESNLQFRGDQSGLIELNSLNLDHQLRSRACVSTSKVIAATENLP